MYLATKPAKSPTVSLIAVNRVDSAVEPTRSQNITVNCRRSASG
jgi:hypothetical protein